MATRGRQTLEFLAHKGIITPQMRANSHIVRRQNKSNARLQLKRLRRLLRDFQALSALCEIAPLLPASRM
jgi:hypothetical protein